MADQGRRSAGDAGGEGESSDGGAVELSLRLRTGSGSSSAAAAEAAARRRSMTIFYNGRVCAVDVTELQARAIITMANQEILTERMDRNHHQDSGSSSSSSSTAPAQPKPPALQRCAAALPASPPRRQGLEAAAPVTINQAAAAGLSMKRSLQRFLQKRKFRAAAVGTAPYAGGTAQPTRHSAMPS